MQIETKPQPGESIRAWLRRVRKNKNEAITPALIERYEWPTIVIEKFTRLTGVGDWLEKNVGMENYIWSCEHFWFTNESDAIVFKLTWMDKADT